MNEPEDPQRGGNRGRPGTGPARAWKSVDETRPEQPAGRRREILAVLRDSTSPLSTAEIAKGLDVHPNTVRFHLDALVEAAQVERVHAEPAGPGRPPLAFRARRGMDPAGPRSYRLLAEILASSLASDPDPGARATEAGRAWSTHLVDRPAPSRRLTAGQAVGRLVGVLDDLGFAPGPPSAEAAQIGLRNCPFLDLIGTRGRVICPLHLGLMQGVMAVLGAPVTVERLDPFAEPGLCVVHLSASGRAS